MPNKDPRQEIISKIRYFLTPTSKEPLDDKGHYRIAGVEQADVETTEGGFRFLREKCSVEVPGRMMLAVTNEKRASGQIFVGYLEQNERGEWRFSGGASTSLGGVSAHPRVNLGGGGWPDHFHAGGYVVDNGLDIARVRLVAANGTIVEDNVQNNIVLFFTDQRVEIPLQAELFDRAGELVSSHNVFGR